MFSSLLGFALLSLALPYTTLASSHGAVPHRRHEAIAAAQNSVANVTEVVEHTLHRRGQTYNNARLTYYEVGLGACGKYNVPSDYIVALNSPMYGKGYPGPNCFRPIAITYKGKTLTATIMDECPGCPGDGGLDLSEGLFKAFASTDEGVLSASWHFLDEGDGGDDKPTTTEKPWTPPTTTWKPWTPEAPKTTSTHKEPEPEPETTSTKHSTTTTKKTSTSSKPTTSFTPSSTSHSTSSTSKTSSSTSSTSSTAAPTPTGPNAIGKLNQAFVGLNELMLAGAQAA